MKDAAHVTTSVELIAATDWQSQSLRVSLSGLRNIGREVMCRDGSASGLHHRDKPLRGCRS